VPTGVGVALGPGHDVRDAGELVVAARAAVGGVGPADVAHDEAVLDAVDAGGPALGRLGTTVGGEGLRLPPPPPAHFRA
jgi:hypothetical protein